MIFKTGVVEDVELGLLTYMDKSINVHGVFDPHRRDAWLLEDIAEYGVLFPIIVTEDNVVVDGYRRFKCSQYLNHTSIPCLRLSSGQNLDDMFFGAAQLARNPTLYAKCILFRDAIRPLMQKDEELKEWDLNGDGGELSHTDNWVQVESVLGSTREALAEGIKFFDALVEMESSSSPEKVDRARSVCSVFRQFGLAAAMRMCGVKVKNLHGEPDCADWQSSLDVEDTPLPLLPNHRKSKDDAFRTLAKLEQQLKGMGKLTGAAREALDDLESHI